VISSILTVTAAASSYDLADLRDVKEELAATDATSDSKLQRYLTAESVRFANACNRVFHVETVSETFRLDFTRFMHTSRPRELLLSRAPVVSITSVTEDDGTALATNEYETDLASGLLYRLDGSGNRLCWAACKIAVVYVAGYAAVRNGIDDPVVTAIPSDVADAVITLVRHRWFSTGRDPALRGQTWDGVGAEQYWVGGTGDAGDLPPDVQAVVDRYREIRM
jgi:hypothetical protein